MKIAIGSDHAGFALKQYLKDVLHDRGHHVVDFGASSTSSVDYPQIAGPLAQAVAAGLCDRGVLICGTGIGMSIAANKVCGIRAALVHNLVTAGLAAQHNDANILCLGARLLASEYAAQLLKEWIDKPFEQRHLPRLDQIRALESEIRSKI